MEVLSNLEFCCMGSTFHCPIMNHSIAEDPQAVRDRQEVIREQQLVSLNLEFKFLKCILSVLKYFTRNPGKFFDYYYVSSVLAENFVSSFEKFSVCKTCTRNIGYSSYPLLSVVRKLGNSFYFPYFESFYYKFFQSYLEVLSAILTCHFV